jgi:hypothetical protein
MPAVAHPSRCCWLRRSPVDRTQSGRSAWPWELIFIPFGDLCRFIRSSRRREAGEDRRASEERQTTARWSVSGDCRGGEKDFCQAGGNAHGRRCGSDYAFRWAIRPTGLSGFLPVPICPTGDAYVLKAVIYRLKPRHPTQRLCPRCRWKTEGVRSAACQLDGSPLGSMPAGAT